MGGRMKSRVSQSAWLAYGLVGLAAGLVVNALLGPLFTETIRYHYSDSLINQGIAVDAVALAAAAIGLVAALLVLRGHRAGPILAFIPATFTAYMAPQYIVGPDYVGLPGNNEQFFLLHLGLLVVAVALILAAWASVDRDWLGSVPRVSNRRRSWAMLGVAAFIALGRWLSAVLDLMSGQPSNPDYLENPTAYLLLGILDLGLVVPAAVTAAIGLRIGARWARTASYAVIGWFTLVPASVAAMSITMQINDDPNASNGATVLFIVAGIVFSAGALALYRSLFTRNRAELGGSNEADLEAEAIDKQLPIALKH